MMLTVSNVQHIDMYGFLEANRFNVSFHSVVRISVIASSSFDDVRNQNGTHEHRQKGAENRTLTGVS